MKRNDLIGSSVFLLKKDLKDSENSEMDFCAGSYSNFYAMSLDTLICLCSNLENVIENTTHDKGKLSFIIWM